MDSDVGDHRSRIVETHTARVVLIGDRAYKVKKPVRFDFVDFRSPEARLAACHRELELNRRLAPSIYREVLELRETDGTLRDGVLVMERLPAERQLSALVESGTEVSENLAQVAHLMAAFHSSAESEPQIGFAATYGPFFPAALHSGAEQLDADRMEHLWEENIAQLRVLVPQGLSHRIDEIGRKGLRYLQGRRTLLWRRTRDGRVRDGHGDLRCDSVFCLGDGPRITDCLEFDPELRLLDGLCDVAYLAADLDYRGRSREAAGFLDSYREFSGDNFPISLARLFKAYWCCVRAKVACITARDGYPDAEDRFRWLALAEQMLEESRVRIVLIGGQPGVGKSAVAAAVADIYGWSVLRSDELREQIAPSDYSPGATAATYATMLERAADLAGNGESVILDATWAAHEHRRAARAMAAAVAGDPVEILCATDEATVRRRIETRAEVGKDISEADTAVSTMIAQRFDPWPEAYLLDTSDELHAVVASAAARILS